MALVAQSHITSEKECAAVACQNCPSVHICYISGEQINSLKPFLNEKCSDIVTVHKTHQTHCFKSSDKEKLMAFPHPQHFALSAYAGSVPLVNKTSLVKNLTRRVM